MTTQSPLLNQSILLAKDWLNAFAESTNFTDILTQAFGSLFDPKEAQAIRQKWILGDFSDLPVMELLSGSFLQGANGAYAASRNTIYLSQDYLQANINNPAAIASVLIEEIGHYLDNRINSQDTPGDEGQIFSALVQGVSLSKQQLQVIQSEDDRATITVDGQQVQAEQSNDYTITQLTNNNFNDYSLIYKYNSNIIWTGFDGNDFEYYFYNGDTITQLTNNNINDQLSSIKVSGNNFIWRDLKEGYNDQYKLYLCNGSSTIQLTDNAYIYGYSYSPKILGNNVVWMEYDGNDTEMYLYNNNKTTQLTNNDYNDSHPDISENKIVWGGTTIKNGLYTDDIYLYNGNSTSKITDDNDPVYLGGYSPKFVGNSIVFGDYVYFYAYNGSEFTQLNRNNLSLIGEKVAWRERDDNDYEIYFYNGSKTIQLTNNNSDDYLTNGGWWSIGNNVFFKTNDGVYFYNGSTTTKISNNYLTSGNNIVWSAFDGLYLYNGSTTIQLATDHINNFNKIAISGNNVAWIANSGIYLYNGSSTIQLINRQYKDPNNVGDIKFSGNNICWSEYDGNDYEIYLATPSPTSPPPPPPPPPQISISDSTVTVAAGEDKTATIKFTVSLSKSIDVPITVEYYTNDGTATSVVAGVDKKDYENTKKTLTFAPGEKTKEAEVTVYGDTPINDKTLEIFAKDTAYRNWSAGADIDAGLTYGDLGYQVGKIFDDTDTSYYAVGLTSDEKFFLKLANPTNAAIADDTAEGTIYDLGKTPVLANRGTQQMPQDVFSDLNVNGIGYDQFSANKAQIHSWLSKVSTLEGTNNLEVRPNLTGHSLGGALTQWIGASYQGNLGKIATFNSPGISPLQGINLNANNNLGVQHYINAGDLVSMAGSQYLNGTYRLGNYSKLLSSLNFEKHSVPFLLDKVARNSLQKPADLTLNAEKGTDSLSSFWFTYLPNRDYLALQTAFASLGSFLSGSPLTGAYLAAALSFRGTVEPHRTAIGLAVDAVQQAISSGKITYNQLQSVWDASTLWVSSAWDTIIDQSKKKLGLSSTSPTANNNLNSNNLNSFVQSSTTPEDLAQSQLLTLNTATTQNETPTVNDFWDAAPKWSTDAWQATANWSSETWKSINEWTPQTFQASTTWAADTWQQSFISVLNNIIVEGDPNTSSLNFTVALSEASTQTVKVNYATTNGTAIAGNDYIASNGTLTFNPGETLKTISVPIVNNNLNEPDETFIINLSNPTNAYLPEGTATGIISDTLQSAVTTTLPPNVENLTLTGTGNINGTGNAGNNIITGNSGNNVLNGLAGNDSLIGGAGNDTYIVDSIGDITTEALNDGTDTVQSNVTWTLANNLENLTLIGTAAINGTGNTLNNTIIGNTAANTLDGGVGNDLLNGGTGIDSLIGGAGNDIYVVDNAGDVVSETSTLSTEIDTVQSYINYTLGANLENLTLIGTAAINATGNTLNNTITGNTAANTLDGGVGNDILNGGTGIDSLIGGAGNDIYVVDNAADVVSETSTLATEIDTVQSYINYTLGANLENLTLLGTAAINGTGNTLNNTITGNTAANTLTGSAGNDTLNGNTGADTLIGGVGDDIYYVDNAADITTEALNAGTDTVQSTVTWTLADNLENLTLTGTAAINGTGNALSNSITGNSATNTLTGGDGNDILNGGVGADTMIGGLGNDIYYVENAADITTEALNAGTDTVQSNVTWTLADNLENLTLTGTAAINGTGNTLNNTIIGNSANNTLRSGAGNDTLNGGTGANTLIGGAGNDIYIVDSISNITTEALNDGTDTVQSSITWTLANNLENLTLTGTAAINGTGNTLNNTITGNTAANTLDGGAGNDILNGGTGIDSLIGGAGNDIYVVDNAADVVSETSTLATEIDTVQSYINYTLGANLENLTLIGTAAINATGNTLNNTIIGNTAANTLDGGAGNDILNGGTGIDSLIGGAGNDIYYVENAGDITTEALNAGTDTVSASLTWTLADHVENLALAGTAAINGTGNALSNTITGNAADNTLDGGTGIDTLTGMAGNDILVGGDSNDLLTGGIGADSFRFNSKSEGVDTIQDFTLAQSDVIQILATGFGGGLVAGTLSANMFVSGGGVSAPTNSSQRFIYNTTNGFLFFDADGNGTNFATTQIATFSGAVGLSNSNIFVI